MKLVTFTHRNEPARIGIWENDTIVELESPSMLDFIRGGEVMLERARKTLNGKTARTFSEDEVTLLAPIPRPGKVLCSGLNYRSHVEENPSAKFLEDPRFFAKFPSVVIGPDAEIRHPGQKFLVDYEVELAVVIGREMPQGTPAHAVMDHVFGYTILNDVSARWIQFKDNNEMMGKNFDTFAPIGPCIVTADKIKDPSQLSLSLRLNGKVMQDGTNRDWCFPLPRLLEWLSMAMTLEPGDIISTGTPAGIGYFRKPQVFLKPGDVCELEIGPIGVLRNRVVAAEKA